MEVKQCRELTTCLHPILTRVSVWFPVRFEAVGVSFVMAILTYLTAPWFIHVFRRLNWKMIPLAQFMRSANAFASTFLYLLMGMDGKPVALAICAERP
jgi:hypothetical protein